MATPDWSWQEDAACHGEDSTLFFSRPGESTVQRDVREWKAMTVCRRCPVVAECLAYALDRPEKYGVWGGLNEGERHSMRRRRMRYAAASRPEPEPAPLPTVVEKLCHGCSETLPAGEFPRDRRSSDGLNSRCRGCANEAGRQRRAEAKQAVA